MNIEELIHDLRARINPQYYDQIGTESYERYQVVMALEYLRQENERLKADAERIEWQPIETAPKGVRILGYRPNFGGDKFYECEWIDRDDCEMWKVGATVSTIKAFPQFKPNSIK